MMADIIDEIEEEIGSPTPQALAVHIIHRLMGNYELALNKDKVTRGLYLASLYKTFGYRRVREAVKLLIATGKITEADGHIHLSSAVVERLEAKPKIKAILDKRKEKAAHGWVRKAKVRKGLKGTKIKYPQEKYKNA